MKTIAIDTEIWKPVFGYDYEVSNIGRVKNIKGDLLKPLGPLQLKVECAHLNGKELDNRFINLKWATHKENENHKRLHGTMRLGEDRFGAKLNDNSVLEIRRLYRQGVSGKELAKRFDVCNTIISRVVNRRIWSHI